jgi:hypothetical protein
MEVAQRSDDWPGGPDLDFQASNRAPKKTHSPRSFGTGGFDRGDAMTDVMIDLERPLSSLVSKDIPSLSDDECLVRLAQAVADPDSDRLDEIARLIGRLAVTIE